MTNILYRPKFFIDFSENNDEESGDDEEIDIKLTEEKNVTNKNNENVIEIDLLFMYPFLLFMYPFLFQIVLHLKKKMILNDNFPKISQ